MTPTEQFLVYFCFLKLVCVSCSSLDTSNRHVNEACQLNLHVNVCRVYKLVLTVVASPERSHSAGAGPGALRQTFVSNGGRTLRKLFFVSVKLRQVATVDTTTLHYKLTAAGRRTLMSWTQGWEWRGRARVLRWWRGVSGVRGAAVFSHVKWRQRCNNRQYIKVRPTLATFFLVTKRVELLRRAV